MNLPNKLTVLRIVLTFAFIVFLLLGGMLAKFLALVTFLIASFTDILDGFFAKKHNQFTAFGKLMDPIADKILILSAFIVFVEIGIVPAWMVVIIILREVAVTALRFVGLTRGKVIVADGGGKQKTVWQVFVIFVILLFLLFNEGGQVVFSFWTENSVAAYKEAIFVFMLITVVLTLLSGVSYFVRNKGVYSNEETN